ncbi:MAG: hypothetical protein HQ567_09375 [Candidatus Nealsonbacteria bacterium]|nr:hypothetical protein [Candidatus Nealsonbacteria bacterium]
MRHFARICTILCTPLVALPAAAAEEAGLHKLENEHLTVSFDPDGLTTIHDKTLKRSVDFQGDRFVVEVDGKTIDGGSLKPPSVERHGTSLIYRYGSGQWPIEVVYQLKPGWRFVSKHLRLQLPGEHRVKHATVFAAELQTPVAEEYRHRGGSYGAFLRFADDGADAKKTTFGLFAVIQNPLLKFDFRQRTVSLAYTPDMEWSAKYGPFETDRVCLGTYALSGTRYPAAMLPEWHYRQDPDSFGRDAAQLDVNEVLAVGDCVRAFLTYRPEKSIRIHVDWCENVYQIDLAKPGAWQEYQRIIRRAAQVGCDHILFSPHDENLAPLKDSRDAWGWESLLWLNMGQKVRKGEWIPGKDPLPEVVRQRLDFAKKHGIRLVAYAYPTLPFMQNPRWTEWVSKLPGAPKPGGYRGADTAVRSFQDWLVEQLVAFKRQTGAGGFSFDHWWIAYEQSESGTSKYAQWNGCRRILMELRRQCPDVLIDGRQQYHWFGPWTWVAGSYPHPLASDEQPQSFRSFPDLHWSRGSADRQRYMGWWFRMQCFTPVEIMPGYMMHQTMRSDAKGTMRRDEYRTRDFDYLGWKYSVISSIATAPINHVVNYLPARDSAEFEHFTDADCRWLRDWLDWTDEHGRVLRKLRPIIGQPMVGRCDGTAAIDGDRGFIFLFNPNYRELAATLKLDESIGLTAGKRFVLRQLYPDLGNGRLLGDEKTARGYAFGREVTLPMRGASPMVLELVPLPEKVERPMLLGSVGKAAMDGKTLRLTGVAGEPGIATELAVLLPAETDRPVDKVLVNGKPVAFDRGDHGVRVRLTFAGEPFAKCQQVGSYDSDFQGGTFTGTFSIPQRIFDQLEARRKAWPIPYNDEELEATWTAPHRLLLFVNIADPKDEMELTMKIDDKPIEVKKAYSSVYRSNPKNTFLGFYADLSGLEPDRPYKVDVEVPNLQPGQFQGLFFDNVEPEYTEQID